MVVAVPRRRSMGGNRRLAGTPRPPSSLARAAGCCGPSQALHGHRPPPRRDSASPQLVDLGH